MIRVTRSDIILGCLFILFGISGIAIVCFVTMNYLLLTSSIVFVGIGMYPMVASRLKGVS